MKYCLLILFVIVTVITAKAQNTDTVAKRPIPESWPRYFGGVRFAMGLQKAFYYEAGLSLQKYTYARDFHFTATCIYAAYVRSKGIEKGKPVHGVKAGIENVNTGGGTGGIEVSYLTNSVDEDIVITPKIGLGIGFFTLFYGYNISTNKYPFVNTGRHQFSLAINTNMLFYGWKNGSK